MNGRRLLALSVLAIALACQDNSQPTGPKAPGGPAGLISDGAHGGNPDFFFLPPMVPNPANDPNYEVGKFNASLQSSLTVEVCLLQGPPVNAQGQPVATDCVAGPPVKKFAAGTVKLLGLPDGYYQVLWNTRESNLDVTKYYRIKVLIEGLDTPLGIADVDPMENKSQLKNARTGEVIPLNDDSSLPIKFRVENGGGPTLCGGATLCASGTITNTTPNGEPQFVRVPADDGSFIAGVLIPSGFLPPDGPQTVVLTIAGVNTGANDVSTGTQAVPCHANLPLQQFNSCFHFRTYPELEVIEGSEEGHQFLRPITVAVCFVLHDIEPTDPREQWVQLWSSDPDVEGGDSKPLPSAPVSQILSGPSGENCGDVLVAVNDDSNGLTRFASVGWHKVKNGLNRVFGVQTAYAVDLGIGGLAFDLSNIGPALTAQIRAASETEMTVLPGSTNTVRARVVGTTVHNGQPLGDVTLTGNTHGIPGLPITLSLAPGNGTMIPFFSEGPPVTQATILSSEYEDSSLSGGFASVSWTVPTAPGIYTLTATGPAFGGAITFTATVVAPPPNFIQLGPTERRMLSMQTGASIQIGVTPPDPLAQTDVTSGYENLSLSCLPNDPACSTHVVTAVVGGENIAGSGAGSITSVLSSGNPGPSLLVNSFAFDLFPRTTTLVWNAVAGAVSYTVITEFGNASVTDPFCELPADCGLWTVQPAGTTTIPGLMHTFDFVGSQPGRWQVFAWNAAGVIINTSPRVYFDYDI
jgi:hypothetical protein